MPAAKADSQLEAKEGLCRISEMKPEGAAVMRTERMGAVGSSDASCSAMGPRERSTAGSVGRAVMPASDALNGKNSVHIWGQALSWG